MSLYLLAALSFIAVLAVVLVARFWAPIVRLIKKLLRCAPGEGNKEKEQKIYTIVLKVVSIVAVVVFFARFMSFREVQLLGESERIIDFRQAGAGPFADPALNQFGNICIWFEVVAFLTIVATPFFDSKITKFISLYISTPLILVCFAGMPYMYGMMVGVERIGFTYYMFGHR